MGTVDQSLQPGQAGHGEKGSASHSTTLVVWVHKGDLVDAGTSSGNRWDTARTCPLVRVGCHSCDLQEERPV